MTRLLLFVSWFVFCALFSVPARAAAPIYQYAHNVSNSPTPGWFESRTALCSAWTAWATGDSGNTYECVPPQDSSTAFYYRYLNRTTGQWTARLTQAMKWRSWCANGAAPDTTKPLDQQCVEVTPPKKCNVPAGGSITFRQNEGTGPAGAKLPTSGLAGWPTMSPTCQLTGPPSLVDCYGYTDGAVERFSCEYTGTSNGQDTPDGAGPVSATEPPAGSTRTDVPPKNAPDGQRCPEGSVQGGVSSDGVPICIGTGTAPKNAPPPQPKVETEKTEATSDGGSKTTQTSTTTNADGSTTTITTTTTTAPDGSKTTTVDKNTTNNSLGGAGKDDSQREDEKYDLCKQNPMLTICRNSSVAGTCGQITCQGDAIQCATLRAAAAMQCQQQADIESLKTAPTKALGDAILGGAESEKTMLGDLVKGTQVDMSKPNIDDSAFLAASCFANRSINVLGHSVEMDFTRVCNDIQPLRAAIMAVAFLVAYLIVSRSVLQS